ncbi:MAG TPA: hypothetical protein VFF73_39805, partial [Planctomycetota bacterium]|nr:hypothetical protein [Planctomycetota bacterium]
MEARDRSRRDREQEARRGSEATFRTDEPPDRETVRDAMKNDRPRDDPIAGRAVLREPDAIEEGVSTEADQDERDDDDVGSSLGHSVEQGGDDEPDDPRDEGGPASPLYCVREDVHEDDAGDRDDDEAVQRSGRRRPIPHHPVEQRGYEEGEEARDQKIHAVP